MQGWGMDWSNLGRSLMLAAGALVLLGFSAGYCSRAVIGEVTVSVSVEREARPEALP